MTYALKTRVNFYYVMKIIVLLVQKFIMNPFFLRFIHNL
jgi:hypothetical protein